MKKEKLLIIVLMTLLCVACTNNTTVNKSAKKIAMGIVSNLQSDEINIDDYTETEKEVLYKYLETQEKEEYIINLDEVHTYPMNENYKENNINDKYVYKEDGANLIKYNDITWTEDDYATILVNGKRRILFKASAGLFKSDTYGDLNYTYVYEFSNDYGDKIEFYYKSLTTTDGLVVRVYKEKKNISKIYLIPENEVEYEHEQLKNNDGKKIKFFSTSTVAIIVVAVAIYGIAKILKR